MRGISEQTAITFCVSMLQPKNLVYEYASVPRWSLEKGMSGTRKMKMFRNAPSKILMGNSEHNIKIMIIENLLAVYKFWLFGIVTYPKGVDKIIGANFDLLCETNAQVIYVILFRIAQTHPTMDLTILKWWAIWHNIKVINYIQ